MIQDLGPFQQFNPNTPILITGGTGFVGSHLVEMLIEAGFSNVHVTTMGHSRTSVHEFLPESQIHELDLSNQAAVFEVVQALQPTFVFHLAALAAVGSSFEQAHRTLQVNLSLQLNILEAIREKAPQARLLVVGSGMEYDLVHPDLVATNTTNRPISESHPLGPVSPYAVSKVVQDMLGLSYAYSYDLDVVRARPFNHLGERQTPDFAIPSFAQQIVAIERGQQTELKVGNLSAVRDFSDVRDVCRAYLLLMAKGEQSEVYNIGSGQGHQLQEVLAWMCQLSTVDISVIQDTDRLRPLDIPVIIADISKIQALGWQPQIPLKDTLQRVLNYWRAQP